MAWCLYFAMFHGLVGMLCHQHINSAAEEGTERRRVLDTCKLQDTDVDPRKHSRYRGSHSQGHLSMHM